jgi:hypothetical protein
MFYKNTNCLEPLLRATRLCWDNPDRILNPAEIRWRRPVLNPVTVKGGEKIRFRKLIILNFKR